ncbi:MAG: hypothetical protein HZA28_08650 [Candidatus Omnitrophica bacterium]|nr:hypothetical protein [Candidatus Omnitrophota bacterium]
MSGDRTARWNFFKRLFCVFFLAAFCLTQSGCALLQVPLALVQLPFTILQKVMGIVSKLPKPPPGVIPGAF